MATDNDGVRRVSNPHANAKHGDYAYFPGTGPKDKWCEGCIAFIPKVVKSKTPSPFGKCERVAELRSCTTSEVGWIRAGTQACKYFSARPAKKA